MAQLHSEELGNVAANAVDFTASGAIRPRLRVLWIRVQNLDDADAWINLYASAAADVTPGTDRHGPPIHVPASSVQPQPETIPIDALIGGPSFSVFASDSADGTGEPTTGVRVDVAFERVG